MCLGELQKVTNSKKNGVEYKVVKKLPDGRYAAWYHLEIVYELGMPFTAKRTAPTDASYHDGRYVPLVHLYKTLGIARAQRNRLIGEEEATILECEYRRATWQDNTQIVAWEITPIKEVE